MNGAEVIAQILKLEGTEFFSCYPRNAVIEPCAAIDIRPILCRQERVGVGIADGYSRIKRGKRNGVFGAQAGPGIENAFPGIAQAFSENVPMLIVAGALPLARQYVRPVFRAADVYRPVTKWSALAHSVQELPDLMRRAYHAMRSGKPGPVLIELPEEVAEAEFQGHARLQAGAGGAHRARSGRHQEGGRDAARRQEPGAVGRPGRALRGGRREARGACRDAARARGRHQSRQERHCRQPSAGAWRRDALAVEDVRRLSQKGRRHHGDRVESHGHQFRPVGAEGQNRHSFDQ